MGFDEAISYANLRLAARDCMKNNRWKASIQGFELDMAQLVADLSDALAAGEYSPLPTVNFYLLERGKTRYIRAHHIIDRVWYKSWCTHDLKPWVEGRIMDHNSASQEGKGTDHSINIFRQALAHAYKLYGKDFYVVTTDYHDYFGSIPHGKIVESIGFTDPRSENVLREYLKIFAMQNDSPVGIGIGGEPSQIIAIIYPSSVDRTVACNCPTIASGRYMDDSWFICHTKEEANYTMKKFKEASEKLGLVVNEKRTQMHHMTHESVTWLKKRTHLTESGKIVMKLTKKNIHDRYKVTKKYFKEYSQETMPLIAALESIRCWSAYANKYNSHKALQTELNHFGQAFEVPHRLMNELLNRNTQGWLAKCERYLIAEGIDVNKVDREKIERKVREKRRKLQSKTGKIYHI